MVSRLFILGDEIFVSGSFREKKTISNDYRDSLLHLTPSGYQSIDFPYDFQMESLSACEGSLYGITPAGLNVLNQTSWKNLAGFASPPVSCGGKTWILANYGRSAALYPFDSSNPQGSVPKIRTWISVSTGDNHLIATDGKDVFRFESNAWKPVDPAPPKPVIELLPSDKEIITIDQEGDIRSFQNGKWVLKASLDRERF